ncbi:Oca4p KNAG_0I02630 [Huiozyma naganishii CBS 8797]|uniref:Protein OCA4 n=1 Tax=Huiozyma naganishii (strain ATCC MYA-139 / BCRC 22969 / CBS 8797 / KCTC 17520 / NBRC 10181 / NCYC 3082 / Yp74L-3) TaxID=1071383 RepID=J7RQI9_HUIN7|nr:hypothetical protein KNAG_0I02630 [Kazachstania naganishii CBS 8797]CCK72048.1 hypothetical protein KNAG_0I02630 [Kazachstania naganishii CBS 8797]
MLVPPANFGIAEEGIYRCSKVETLNLSFIETLSLKSVVYIGGQEPSKFFKEFFNRSSIEWSVIRIADISTAGAPINNDNNPGSNEAEDLHATQKEEKKSSTNITKSTSLAKYPNRNPDSVANEGNRASRNDDLINLNKMGDSTYSLNDRNDLMLIKSSCLKKTFRKLLDCQNYNILLIDKTALIIGILRKIQKWSISSIINEYRLYSGKNRSYFAETFLDLIDIAVEQDQEDIRQALAGKTVRINNTENLAVDPIAEERQRKLSNVIVVSEHDLSDPPQVPHRLLKMVEEAEKNERLNLTNGDLVSSISAGMQRSTSNLGIFGHRYRLAFNGKENGRYNYYKSPNTKADALTLQIPREANLPSWFTYQRDLWEKENVPNVHHFYKEHIFT